MLNPQQMMSNITCHSLCLEAIWTYIVLSLQERKYSPGLAEYAILTYTIQIYDWVICWGIRSYSCTFMLCFKWLLCFFIIMALGLRGWNCIWQVCRHSFLTKWSLLHVTFLKSCLTLLFLNRCLRYLKIDISILKHVSSESFQQSLESNLRSGLVTADSTVDLLVTYY